jgi:hypothetical protein
LAVSRGERASEKDKRENIFDSDETIIENNNTAFIHPESPTNGIVWKEEFDLGNKRWSEAFEPGHERRLNITCCSREKNLGSLFEIEFPESEELARWNFALTNGQHTKQNNVLKMKTHRIDPSQTVSRVEMYYLTYDSNHMQLTALKFFDQEDL